MISTFLCLVSLRLEEYFYGKQIIPQNSKTTIMSTIEKKAVKVGKYVNTEHVDTLIRNYKTERWMPNSERIGKEDTLGLWLSAEELEEFIQTAKMHGADGIRLCFGVYGEKSPIPGMEGKQTVAFVATSSELDEVENVVNKDLYIKRNGERTLLAYNMIKPFPPEPSTPSGPSILTLKAKELGSMMISDKEQGIRVI